MSEKQAYFKLSFGDDPKYAGYFDTPQLMQQAVPRLRDQLIDDGAIKLVKKIGDDGKELEVRELREGEPLTMLAEAIEMTPEEYQAIQASNIGWAN